MAYIVKAFTPGKLNLAPETLEEEVLQNVAIIVSTEVTNVTFETGETPGLMVPVLEVNIVDNEE